MQGADSRGSGPVTRAGARMVQYGNQLKIVPPPFFAIPSWWRRFLFRILSPRELAVYLYVCSLLDKNSLAFPTQNQIAYEMGISGTDAVARAVKRLVRLGFLIRNTQYVSGTQRTVYQRPAAEFTLLCLLDEKAINNELFPGGKEPEIFNDDLDTTESAVALGLQSLLGRDAYDHYVSNMREKPDALRFVLLKKFQNNAGQSYEEALKALHRVEEKQGEEEFEDALGALPPPPPPERYYVLSPDNLKPCPCEYGHERVESAAAQCGIPNRTFVVAESKGGKFTKHAFAMNLGMLGNPGTSTPISSPVEGHRVREPSMSEKTDTP